MKSDSKPPFVECYEHEGVTLWMNSGDPIKVGIAKNTILRNDPSSVGSLLQMAYAGFWILEGILYSQDLTAETHPSLVFYLSNREGLSMDERWELYANRVQTTELDILRLAYENTRRNVFETMAELPVEKKEN
jgi:hypothetical protein